MYSFIPNKKLGTITLFCSAGHRYAQTGLAIIWVTFLRKKIMVYMLQ